jgi:hypothetical protein
VDGRVVLSGVVRGAVSPLKIKIPSKNMCKKPTNTPIIHSVY